MSVIVSEDQIAKHYELGPRTYRAYRKYEQLDALVRRTASRREIARLIGLPMDAEESWRSTVTHLRQGKRPACVKGIEFLQQRGLVPLYTDSTTLGLVAHIAGLNWHSGCVSIPAQGQPAFVAEFNIKSPFGLDAVARALNTPCKVDERYNRYRLPSQYALLLSELGIPQNGRKTACEDAYPSFIESLVEAGDTKRLALFLGTQVMTRYSAKGGSGEVYSIAKKDVATAMHAGYKIHALYRQVFPGITFSLPRLSRNDAQCLYSTVLRLSPHAREAIVQTAYHLLDEEIARVKAIMPLTALRA